MHFNTINSAIEELNRAKSGLDDAVRYVTPAMAADLEQMSIRIQQMKKELKELRSK